MKMKAGPNPSLSSSLSLGGVGGGQPRGETGGLWALIRGREKGRLQRVGGRLALLSQLDRPTSCLGPQFPH